MKAVTLLSGGLDSTTLAYHMKDAGYELICLSFDYGQRHVKELGAAHYIAVELGAEWHTVTLEASESHEQPPIGKILVMRPLSAILGGSALTDSSVPVPDGHYAEDNMKVTVVPNRNAIMLSIAYGVAVARGAELVAFAAHSGDHRIYPDCRPDFVVALNHALRMGNEWADPRPDIVGPFLDFTKGWIANRAWQLKVPIDKTWSCYRGLDIHCGTCGTCYERREAFEEAGVVDPTVYLDNTTRFASPV